MNLYTNTVTALSAFIDIFIPRNKNQQIEWTPKSTKASKTVFTRMVRPGHCDDRGFCFGGQVLSWIDIAAGVCAKRHAENAAVTASVDSIHFLSPVKLGDLCNLYATINRSWNTSMEVGVVVESENMLTGERRYCCHAFLTFVSVTEGRPVLVAPILPQNEDEETHYANAQTRRQERFNKKASSMDPKPITSQSVQTFKVASPTVKSTRTKREDRASFGPEDGQLLTIEKPLSRLASDSYTEVVEIVFPEHANSLGITFGGQIMKWMEYCAVMTASKHCRTHLLTASMDSITFLTSTRIGDAIVIKGIVSEAFSHSLEVYVTVERENLSSSKREMTNNGWLTFVSVEKNGSLSSVPSLIAEHEDEISRKRGAILRRNARIKEKDELAQIIY